MQERSQPRSSSSSGRRHSYKETRPQGSPSEENQDREKQQQQQQEKKRGKADVKSGNKYLRKIQHKRLLTHFTNPENAFTMDQRHEASPPAQSPSNQNLSYHQQQQLHQQQIQRTGGLHRLTADLVGLQFNDTDALFKNAQMPPRPPKRGGQVKTVLPPTVRSPMAGLVGSSKNVKLAKAGEQQQQQQGHQGVDQQGAEVPATVRPVTEAAQPVGGYEEQMNVPAGGSQGSDYDPAKDAQDTAEDAAILNRFKIIHLVGTGNYARVYKAMSQTGKELAIKSINLSKTSENYKQKFLPRELTILKRVNHVNVCKIHEIVHVADRIFIVMQFCPKGTIADLLHKVGPLSEPQARNLFIQTTEAVCYLHSLDLAHRDLKVENILLDNDYCPKLTDFSYSIFTSDKNINNKTTSAKTSGNQKQASSQKQSQSQKQLVVRLNDTFCGTLPYLSPEMIRQYPYDSKKTDIWSLGVCLYVMLNDRLPFPFNDIKLMVKKQITKDYKFKANLEFSDQIKDLVSQMLEPDYSKRLTCTDVSRHPWMSGPREKPAS